MPAITLSPDQPFDLSLTLTCGQAFRWEKTGNWWYGVVEDRLIRVRQDEAVLKWTGADASFIRSYFSLDLDLESILHEIDRDPVMNSAIEQCHGLRILRQPPWECLASYICATYSNIPRIRQQIAMLAKIFGQKCRRGSVTFHTFPDPRTLATARDCHIGLCRLGYRASYLCETARVIASDPGWVDRIGSLSYQAARKELIQLKGVGPKVADCVLLFAFGRYEAVPIDVWIRRIMERHYPGPYRPDRYDEIAGYARAYFGRFAGYAQEYLYCAREDLAGEIRREF